MKTATQTALQTILLSVLCVLVIGAAAPAGRAEDGPDFQKDVLPILQARCFKCHGDKKVKARLRLHTAETALRGGKSGKAIVPGDPDASLMIQRVSLPADDDDIMPPEGDPLTKQQIDVLRRWIGAGAAYPEVAGGTLEPEAAAGPPLTDVEKQKLEALRAAGARAMPLAQNVNWLTVSFQPIAANAGDEQLALVTGIRQIVRLDLAGTKVTDEGLAHLAGLTHLQQLHLERTGVQGSGLVHLKGLAFLEYLNLYGTRVGDAALKHLEGLESLAKLYLWQTEVTDEAATALKEALPDLYINLGVGRVVKTAAERQAERKKEEERKKLEAEKAAGKPRIVVAAGSDGWRHAAASAVTGDGWVAAAFDDKQWATGKAPLGYGEALIEEKKGTVIDLQGQPLVFRKEFDLAAGDLGPKVSFRLQVASDNSAIVWINGRKVDEDTANHEAEYWNRAVDIPAEVFAKGRNVLAVRLDNTPGSSDAVLDVQLETVAAGPEPRKTREF